VINIYLTILTVIVFTKMLEMR